MKGDTDNWAWDVQMRLPDGETWFTVCSCDTPESTQEIVRCLIECRGNDQIDILIHSRGA